MAMPVPIAVEHYMNRVIPWILVAITTQTQGLPRINCASMVRDLRAAARVNGNFAALMTSFAEVAANKSQTPIKNSYVVCAKGLRCNRLS